MLTWLCQTIWHKIVISAKKVNWSCNIMQSFTAKQYIQGQLLTWAPYDASVTKHIWQPLACNKQSYTQLSHCPDQSWNQISGCCTFTIILLATKNKFSENSCVLPHWHTHPFNGPLSGTTRVSWYQKGKTKLDFTEARDSEWQWNPLGHMQVCISL